MAERMKPITYPPPYTLERSDAYEVLKGPEEHSAFLVISSACARESLRAFRIIAISGCIHANVSRRYTDRGNVKLASVAISTVEA